MTPRLRSDRGFTLPEVLLTVALVATIAAMAVPVMNDVTASIKLNEAARMVERELQDARLRAVSSNRILRVRFNCPAAGQIRTVEFLNSSADTASNRCALASYPYPAADNDVMTRPNYDGPIVLLPTPATVPTMTLQFHPDGTAKQLSGTTVQSITYPVTIYVSRYTLYKQITVNGAGKIQLQ